MRMIGTILLALVNDFRETLPATTDEAGPFMAGFVWAFVIHWVILIAATWAYCSQRGGC
jgi:hypothetical protein